MVAPVNFGAEAGDDAELRRVLCSLARERSTITYAQLADLLEQPGPHRIHAVTQRLEKLMEVDAANGSPLLAALVVGKNRVLPQRGFFLLLNELGRYDGPGRGPEAEAFHREELELAWSWWGDDA